VDPSVAYTRTADGVNIAYTVTGSGPGFVMLPGVPFSNYVAEWQIPVLRRAYLGLADRLRIVQYDGRGTGHSQRDVEDLSLEGMLLDLEAVVDAARMDRFALFGFYHSALHAIAFAARHPERVTRLVLFGGSLRGWEPMSGAGTQALLSLIDRDWDTFAESVAHAWLGWPEDEEGRLAAQWFRTAATPEVVRRVLREASAVDVTNEAAAVSCEVLVLHRREATVIPLEVSERLAATLPHAELRILDGASAALFFEGGDDVVRQLVRFVSGAAVDGEAGFPARRTATDRGGGAPTARELEVLRLLAAGKTNAEIASDLGLSVNTIERHVGNLYRKIDARGRADATAWAIRRGLA
jgi:pimeloyl-ACP methyl ester carboxylesterase/DNA-binding CsgD family transcriptional regulator